MNKILEFSDISRSLINKIEKSVKQSNGIYFTPPETIKKNIQYLQPFMQNIKEVLEPSCGSCEYISQIRQKYNNINITGIELNTDIFETIKIFQNNNTKLLNDNYITYDFKNKFDLIIGNPPYFVIKKQDVPNIYHSYYEGRPNIFILFIIKSLHLLSSDGILSFVLPKNFLNCLYYDKTRKYINENYKILKIIECTDNFIETQQDTIIIIVQNNKSIQDNKLYTINISNFTIFGLSENIIKLNKLYNNSKTLFNLGFNVSVGSIVWNQYKNELTTDKNKTLLVYSSDIKNNKLLIQNYSNQHKKNYINKKGLTCPLLVINRGYGVGSYNFNYCIINEYDNNEYLIENHLISIKYTKPITNKNLIKIYKKIIKSFQNEKTIQFIKLYFGNNAINTTELSKILPIYTDF
jgi:adenine-specific DNA-methyltransferase